MSLATHTPFAWLPAEVALEPVYNVLNSMALLNKTAWLPHIRALVGDTTWPRMRLNDWAARTAAALAPERRQVNRLVFEGLRDVVAPTQEWPDFPAYLEDLAAQNPVVLRDRALHRLCRPLPDSASRTPDPSVLLADVQAYLARIAELHPDEVVDADLHTAAHALLNDPAALHDLVAAHLAFMWETTLADEWRRATSGRIGMLPSQVNVFRQCLDPQAPAGPTMSQWARPGQPPSMRLAPHASAAEAFRTFTGRPLPDDVRPPPGAIERIVLVPSPHVGQYVTIWYSDGVLRVFFGAPPNYAVLMRSSEVGRAELRARLAPLADETCLRILELLVHDGELQAQDLIDRLGLSQSSVSRHLKQLSTYLFERRGEGATKIYTLNTIELNRTIRALDRLLAGAVAPVEEAAHLLRGGQPAEVQHFLDADGRIVAWPSKLKDQLAILEYLAAKFEPGRSYTEKEVNHLLAQSIAADRAATHRGQAHRERAPDVATLRRALYNYHFLDRERDGSRYWRVEQRDPLAPPYEW